MSQLADVQRFIDASRKVRCAKELEFLITDVCLEMAFDYFALIHHVDLTPLNPSLNHVDDGSLVAITNYPEAWVEAYVARNIVANDPVLLASERTNAGFIWEDVGQFIPVTQEHRLVTEDTRHAGLAAGYTVPANVPGEANGSCNFAVRTGHALPTANLPMAQVVGAFAFQAARTLVLKAKERDANAPKVALTQRQLECILFVARGKTDWEIGKILGISEETVKRHLADARERYDVSKRMQVVMRAVYEGKIALSDILH
jgi:LuxR family quorum-sensing system transcriptional regulator CciR